MQLQPDRKKRSFLRIVLYVAMGLVATVVALVAGLFGLLMFVGWHDKREAETRHAVLEKDAMASYVPPGAREAQRVSEPNIPGWGLGDEPPDGDYRFGFVDRTLELDQANVSGMQSTYAATVAAAERQGWTKRDSWGENWSGTATGSPRAEMEFRKVLTGKVRGSLTVTAENNALAVSMSEDPIGD